jgi:hypothetical protein
MVDLGGAQWLGVLNPGWVGVFHSFKNVTEKQKQ